MSDPCVSIIVPARNEEANIAAGVESLVAQTIPAEVKGREYTAPAQ